MKSKGWDYLTTDRHIKDIGYFVEHVKDVGVRVDILRKLGYKVLYEVYKDGDKLMQVRNGKNKGEICVRVSRKLKGKPLAYVAILNNVK